MRLNQYIANNSAHSRRQADDLIIAGHVRVNNMPARLGQSITDSDQVMLNGSRLLSSINLYVIINKPLGYVCSRHGQGAPTIYELLPESMKELKTAGRLDKDSSGLVLLTNDGQFAYEMTHPKFKKSKIYTINLDKPLSENDQAQLETGIKLPDGVSHLKVRKSDGDLIVTMNEGRNRQIRRTFASLGYKVTKLHRTHFGPFELKDLAPGKYKEVPHG